MTGQTSRHQMPWEGKPEDKSHAISIFRTPYVIYLRDFVGFLRRFVGLYAVSSVSCVISSACAWCSPFPTRFRWPVRGFVRFPSQFRLFHRFPARFRRSGRGFFRFLHDFVGFLCCFCGLCAVSSISSAISLASAWFRPFPA